MVALKGIQCGIHDIIFAAHAIDIGQEQKGRLEERPRGNRHLIGVHIEESSGAVAGQQATTGR